MIKAENLSFSYTQVPFIRSISFEVDRGEIFGFLGPSGAGKSTLQKILTGILPGYSGSAVVSGKEVRNHGNRFYEQIGVDFEFPSFYEKMTARENLAFFGSLYRGPLLPIEKLLESVGLEKDGDKKVSAFSKGMKSRLNFVKAIRHNPDILFLDEPTSGLDPVSSNRMKTLIREQRSQGKAIILTTHNMEDATELCDRVESSGYAAPSDYVKMRCESYLFLYGRWGEKCILPSRGTVRGYFACLADQQQPPAVYTQQ